MNTMHIKTLGYSSHVAFQNWLVYQALIISRSNIALQALENNCLAYWILQIKTFMNAKKYSGWIMLGLHLLATIGALMFPNHGVSKRV